MNRSFMPWVASAVLVAGCGKSPASTEPAPVATDTSPILTRPTPPPEVPAMPSAVSIIRTKSPKERARALAEIPKLQALVQRRAKLGIETEKECDPRLTRDMTQMVEAEKQIGIDLMRSATRYASRAPNLGQTFESALEMCLSCTEKGDDEAVPHECVQAATALDDLAEGLKAIP